MLQIFNFRHFGEIVSDLFCVYWLGLVMKFYFRSVFESFLLATS